MATQPGRLRGKRVRLAISGSAKPDEINDALKRIYGISGCDGCGRNGYDIVLGHGDPLFDGFDAGGVVQGVIVEDIQTR
jgi:hypothetical protein